MPTGYAPMFSLAGTILVGGLLLALVAGVVRGPRVARNLRAALARPVRDPAFLPRIYRRAIFSGVVLAGLALAAVGFSPGVGWADIGFRTPNDRGGGLAAGLLGILVFMVVYGRWQGRRREPRVIAADKATPGLAMLPQTPRERRLAVVIAFVAGIGEEIVFRGVLTAAAVDLLGLPFVAALGLSLLLFAAGHLYQGRAALIGSGLIGFIFAGLYGLSGNLLFPIVAHIVFDLVALLMPVPFSIVPPGSGPPEPAAATPPDALPVPPSSPPTPGPVLVRPPEPSTEDY